MEIEIISYNWKIAWNFWGKVKRERNAVDQLLQLYKLNNRQSKLYVLNYCSTVLHRWSQEGVFQLS